MCLVLYLLALSCVGWEMCRTAVGRCVETHTRTEGNIWKLNIKNGRWPLLYVRCLPLCAHALRHSHFSGVPVQTNNRGESTTIRAVWFWWYAIRLSSLLLLSSARVSRIAVDVALRYTLCSIFGVCSPTYNRGEDVLTSNDGWHTTRQEVFIWFSLYSVCLYTAPANLFSIRRFLNL